MYLCRHQTLKALTILYSRVHICHFLNGDEGRSPPSVRIVARPYGLTKKKSSIEVMGEKLEAFERPPDIC